MGLIRMGAIWRCRYIVQPADSVQFCASRAGKKRQEARLVTIRGYQQRKDEKSEKFHRVESFYGSFERSFSLPGNANAETIRCESKDGILTVHIPKTETAKHKPKQISVQ